MEFEWDDAKNAGKVIKHGLDFALACRVFDDPAVLEVDDPYPLEDRFGAIGLVDERLILVTYTMRGDVCRIISARRATGHERRKYHEVQA